MYNYRFTSKISTIPKILSNIILICKQFLVNEQHGFLKGRSIIVNLCIFKQNIYSFNYGVQSDVIYTNMEKAFYKIDHDLIIIKLNLNYPYWVGLNNFCQTVNKLLNTKMSFIIKYLSFLEFHKIIYHQFIFLFL